MTDVQPFTGFPPEAIRFFEDLAKNNNREWFEANKQIYRDNVVAPAQSFIAALGERLKTLSSGISYDLRTNGSGSMFRIYRDTRFSKDKTPYKTHLGMVFWEGAGKKTEKPAFYVGLDSDGGHMGGGLHGFPKPFMTAYRQAVADHQRGPELVEIIASIRKAGDYEINGEHYKRVPRGFDADHPRADLLRYNALTAWIPPIDKASVTSSEFVDVCFEHCRNIAPLHHWLVALDAGLD